MKAYFHIIGATITAALVHFLTMVGLIKFCTWQYCAIVFWLLGLIIWLPVIIGYLATKLVLKQRHMHYLFDHCLIMKIKLLPAAAIITLILLTNAYWIACMYHYCESVRWIGSLVRWLPIIVLYIGFKKLPISVNGKVIPLFIGFALILTFLALFVLAYIHPATLYSRVIMNQYLQNILPVQFGVIFLIEAYSYAWNHSDSQINFLKKHRTITSIISGFLAAFTLSFSNVFLWASGLAITGLLLDRLLSDVLDLHIYTSTVEWINRFCFSVLFSGFTYLLFQKRIYLKLVGIGLYGSLVIYNYMVFRNFT